MDAAIEKKVPALSVDSVVQGDKVVTTMKLGDGSTREYVVSLGDPLFMDFVTFGICTKIRNSTAMNKDKEGNAPTLEAKIKAVDELLAAFADNEWSVRGSAGEASPTGGWLAKALFNLSNGKKTLEECIAFTKTLDKSTHLYMCNTEPVKGEIARIKPAKVVSADKGAAIQNALAGFLG